MTISGLSQQVIHKICSGQVVVDLGTAVKELVENSLDGGASSIEVRLKEYGIEVIEVSDNGKGICSADYATLALKYYTSKISSFEELESVGSFGFRGEALSSLCAVGEVTVITRTEQDEFGTKLVYDSQGKLESQEQTGRAIGTTVQVRNLFANLPVRQGDLKRNIKCYYAKMLQLLQSYAVISLGVRLHVSNSTKRSNQRQTVIQTTGETELKSNISEVFGGATTKQLQFVRKQTDSWIIEGYVSKGDKIQKSTGDRQLIFVNGRPVDFIKVIKAVNESFRNLKSVAVTMGKPMLFLNIICTQGGIIDVNVTPDKRKIFIQQEKELVEDVRKMVEQIWEPTKCTLQVNQAINSVGNQHVKYAQHESNKPSENISQVQNQAVEVVLDKFKSPEQAFQNNSDQLKSEDGGSSFSQFSYSQQSFKNFFSKKRGRTEDQYPSNKQIKSGTQEQCQKQQKQQQQQQKRDSQQSDQQQQYINNTNCQKNLQQQSNFDDKQGKNSDSITGKRSQTSGSEIFEKKFINDVIFDEQFKFSNQQKNFHGGEVCKNQSQEKIQNNQIIVQQSQLQQSTNFNQRKLQENVQQLQNQSFDGKSQIIQKNTEDQILNGQGNQQQTILDEIQIQTVQQNQAQDHEVLIHKSFDLFTENNFSGNENEEYQIISEKTKFNIQKINKNNQVNVDLQNLKQKIINQRKLLQRNKNISSQNTDLEQNQNQKQKDTSQTQLVEDAQNAEDAEKVLSRRINKSDFTRMQILGQFNLGFIISKLNNDLYIIDQHAADEKYNFEQLILSTVINQQPMLTPQKLDLDPIQKLVITENTEIFNKNGFSFKFDEENDEIFLNCVPFSGGIQFGVSDLLELIDLIQNQEGCWMAVGTQATNGVQNCRTSSCVLRPSKVRAMFASRACRSSIMIGNALDFKKMKKIVRNLSELDQPWNCPHGRPTMRHACVLPQD